MKLAHHRLSRPDFFVIPAIAAVIFAIASASTAQANPFSDAGFYAGGHYGFTKFDNSDFEEDDTALRAFAGIKLTPNLAIDLGYTDFGQYGSAFASTTTDGISLSVKGIYPITQNFALYANAGQLWWESDVEVAGVSDDFNNNDFFYGVGTAYKLVDDLSLTLSYDRYKVDIENSAFNGLVDADIESDVDFVALGLNYTF